MINGVSYDQSVTTPPLPLVASIIIVLLFPSISVLMTGASFSFLETKNKKREKVMLNLEKELQIKMI